MDPAWRQQGRGRGRGQPQGQTSRPQRERAAGPAAESPKAPSGVWAGDGRGRGGDGRGRGGDGRGGDGRGKNTTAQLQPVNRGKNMVAPSQHTASSQSKFEEIRKSNQAAAQRLAQSQYSSSSDDDVDDIVDDGGKVQGKDGKRGQILASTLTTYTDQTGETTHTDVWLVL
ncbi:NF-X1-type zinc finger protein NFXL1 [Salvelinus sp. IW2-2015]|uniref:NF-X1-type zinc finger protein NFXL1 n=1 Tax=Salvelinus sp. IW2-2015 TaxID=2691554 RepID=UPI000CEA7C72|nr:NF-X1-type zinc finger protein NFXL1-like [Salvelinus alpinus]